ncbi:BseRI endonuclease, partial [mine drainage metagenome]
EKIVQDLVTDPLQQRVLDPACGSGTFLFHAVRRRLDAAETAGIGNAEALTGVTEAIYGIDIHPVAVILARVTYLLAMGSRRLQGDRGELTIPVYLGDSLQWQTDDTALLHNRLVVYVDDERGLFSEELKFPATLLSQPEQFDRLVDDLTTMASD